MARESCSHPLNAVARNKAVFETPPSLLPAGGVDVSGNGRWRIWEFAGTKVDAPILGNGDMLAAFAGPPHWPQFWLTTNDFWQMESSANYEFFHDNSVAKHDPPVSLGSPRPVGRMVFDIPALKAASYHTVQDFETATTTAAFQTADGSVTTMRFWVAATENILIVEFNAASDMKLGVRFFFPDETGQGCDTGIDFTGIEETEVSLKGSFAGLIGGKPIQMKKVSKKGVISGYRGFSDQADVPTKVAFAGKFLGETDLEATIRAGKTLYFVLPMRSWAKTSRPYEMACSRAGWITEKGIGELRTMHLLWWKDFWSVSGVMLDDPVMEQRYYLSQYVMASVSRDYDYPPNILGISTFDRMAWNGNYKINYNHQSPYLGLLASGHFEQADAHDAPYLAMMDISREMSLRLLKHEGVYMPLGLGPIGMVSEPLLLHMKSPAVHGAINMMMRYSYTKDREYLKHVYPFLRAVADFWENDLVLENGHYRIVEDGMHERTTKEVQESGMPENATNTLGYLKFFFSCMTEISTDLGIDLDKHETWQSISENLSDYATGLVGEIDSQYPLWRGLNINIRDLLPKELHSLRVFFNEEKGARWSVGFPANIMQIYPAGAIGLDSSPELLQTARNTIHVRSMQEKLYARHMEKSSQPGTSGRRFKTGAWNDGNISCLFFPAAVRVGYDPDIIWNELSDRITKVGLPNGFIHNNPHGIENLSTVPNTIQEMMLLSHEKVIRIFRVWPRTTHPNASFEKLWAFGAFQISAALKDGVVCDVRLVSNKGGRFLLENPWSGRAVEITHMFYGKKEVLTGDRISVETFPGENLSVSPL